DIYSGNDNEIVPMLALGAKGVISVLSNVAPKEAHDICDQWFKGNVEESKNLQLKYLELANTMFIDVNPIPVKEALNQIGWNMGDCRLPLYEMDDAGKQRVHDVLVKYGLLK
ncbi:MAG: dihydrodipicolinate synthase family protein, partial [Clostridia bacterium]|nr:dihydrodipicolinate synthase family protein [Clostridia bacterium]